MKKHIILTSISGALLLSACGGSGGHQAGSGEHAAIVSFNRAQFAPGDKVPESIAKLKKEDADYEENTANKIVEYNSITVDGQSYAIAEVDKNDSRYNYVSSKDHRAVSSGSFLSYSRFAVLNIKDYYNNAFLALGQHTKAADMPVEGKASYSGHGIHQNSGQKDLASTNVSAEVDFAKKEASINIKGSKIEAFSLNGTIKGNQVSGANELKASFYGPQAKELSGSYVKNGEGIFGVVKD